VSIRHFARYVSLAIAVLFWSVGATAQSAIAPSTVPLLQPGDRVLVNVWRKPELSGEFVVTADSSLNHPMYQSVKLVGLPLPVAKERLVAFIGRYEHNPLVTLEPLFRITVGGEVRLPNIYSLPQSATVASAIAGAGGPTERGKLTAVRLYRGGKRMQLNLNDPRSEEANQTIRSGDNIIVGRSGNFFRDVLAPGASLTAALVSILVAIRQ
jgi:protein involved in polysaccharide export with SLBB domain